MLHITKFINQNERVLYKEDNDRVIVYLQNENSKFIVGYIFLDNFEKIVDLSYNKGKNPEGHIYIKYLSVGTSQKVLSDVYKKFNPRWYKILFKEKNKLLLVYKIPFEKIYLFPDKIVHDYEVQHHIILPDIVIDLLNKQRSKNAEKPIIIIEKDNKLVIL